MLHVQPGAVANLCVADVIVLEVLAELVGGSLERGDGLQHGDRQLEVGDVLNERRRTISGLEKVRELSDILCREWDAVLLGLLEHGLGPNRAVEVEMQLGLGDRLKVGGVVHRRFRRMLPAASNRRGECGAYGLTQAERALGISRRAGGMVMKRPSLRSSVQPPSCSMRWCRPQTSARFGSAVLPPRVHQTRWWPSHQIAGR